MKLFWKYIFPALFGLMIYTSIRLVTDTTNGEQFWHRPWQVTLIEVALVMLSAYIFEYLLRYYIEKFNRKATAFSGRKLLTEFGQLFFTAFAFTNILLFFIHYLIADPVSWSDFAIANKNGTNNHDKASVKHKTQSNK